MLYFYIIIFLLPKMQGSGLVFGKCSAILREGFRGFSQSPQANVTIVPKLGHGRFLPNLFQIISHSIIRRSIVLVLKASLN
jgi:hypothetical protein